MTAIGWLKIKQILINLVSNAIKCSEIGIIRLSVKKFDYTYCLKIEDKGIGIAFGNITNIFDESHQVDGSHTRKVGEIGLELSKVSNKIVSWIDDDLNTY